ncbi:Aldehyde dehydrogenase [Fusarium oxysporum f. sp. matthiolae]|nr:Aldehyde dehydrogenase [Fusarium oxysporum f. sp. matthiolae]
MSYQTNLYINGKYVPSSTGETLTIYSPNDDSLVEDKIQVASEADIDDAVKAAQAAFPGWKNTPSLRRAAIMNKFADLLDANVERLATLEGKAMGQPISIARANISIATSIWRYYAGAASKIAGESLPPDADNLYKIVQYEPLGVCAGICAWNGSHLQTSWKAAPAVAAGNTFVLKSSEKTPIALCQYGDLFREAGFPPGVINVVAGAGKVGALLAGHMDIAKVAFTGSVATGRAVQLAATKFNLKRVTLELGGKSPAIIFNDANIANAIYHSSTTFLRNSAQVCVAASRVLVQEDIASKFIQELKVAFEKATTQIGDPSSEKTAFGPLADKKHFDHVKKFVDDSKAEGIEVLAGGDRIGDKGTYLQPTVLLNPGLDSRVYREEIFGPVLCVRTFKDEEEAIKLANDSRFGLGSTIYTADIARALRMAGQIEAGTIGINTGFVPNKATPFGGWKESGLGREGGSEGIKGYLQAKTIHINMALQS